MNSATFLGLTMVLVAGVMNGSFAVPMKWARLWAWENTWLAWTSIALVVLPLLVTLATVPGVVGFYEVASPAVLALVVGCGAAWGVAQVLFGLGLSRAGVALGFAIVLGLAAAAGSLIPFILLQSQGQSRSPDRGVLAGVAVVLAGVALCSYAGSKKEQSAPSSRGGGSWIGILLCVGAGIGGSAINLGIVLGAPLLAQAEAHSVPRLHQINVIWLPLLIAGFILTAVYCLWQLSRNGTWNRFFSPGLRWYWILAAIMAICYFGSVELYGIAAAKLGAWGPVRGWPIFLSTSIITANVWGVAMGEWRQAPRRARAVMLAGVTVLVAAIFVIGLAGQS